MPDSLDPNADPVAYNRRAWDLLVARGDEWSLGFSSEVIARARAGDLSPLVLIGYKPMARDWLPADLRDVRVLCLASGGGQQAPLLAAAGARVTSFDNAPRQLERDREVADREGLAIDTILGDMRDLSTLRDAAFDVVFHPVANLFCPELPPVWRECHRVLRPGGRLLAGFCNPDLFMLDADASARGELVVRHPLPYSDLTSLSLEERARQLASGLPLRFGHSLMLQIGAQLAAGFTLIGFDEASYHNGPTPRFMPGYFATHAIKVA